MSPDLEGLPGMEATVLAEQALLGALLLRPRHLPAIADWLEAGHFYLPHHAALYVAMRRLADDGHAVLTDGYSSDQGLDWLTRTTAVAMREAPGLTPSHAHTLVSICPQPDNAAAYARMVLAGHSRRTIAEHAKRLAHAARPTKDPALQGEAVSAQADALADVLAVLSRHWRTHPGTGPRGSPSPPPSGSAPSDQQHADEQAFLSAATTRPVELKDIRSYLTAEDFADPLHQQLYRCLTALHHRGEPIDPVTVVWEAQHRGILAHTSPETVLTTCAHSGNDPAYWATRILDHSLISAATTTAQHIELAAADPATTPHRLIAVSRHALGNLTTVRLRWHHAHHHGPPTPPRPARPPARGSATQPPPRTTRGIRPGSNSSTPPVPASGSALATHSR
ncbi:DnaB-like helicase N-terminal domain-containing protein [Streptomyces sp. NPDC001262]|uniref:DnaB-like helicase N-terminal domain-containing protein n=1 Tax=Streptomyces sp. NPDC001262 TaxID=3364552 RepID=UPI003681E1C3